VREREIQRAQGAVHQCGSLRDSQMCERDYYDDERNRTSYSGNTATSNAVTRELGTCLPFSEVSSLFHNNRLHGEIEAPRSTVCRLKRLKPNTVCTAYGANE
jgi:hypothetical protein